LTGGLKAPILKPAFSQDFSASFDDFHGDFPIFSRFFH